MKSERISFEGNVVRKESASFFCEFFRESSIKAEGQALP